MVINVNIAGNLAGVAVRAFEGKQMVSLVLLAAWVGVAAAQTPQKSYPTKPVRIVTAGAGTFHDIVTRQLGQRLSEGWGQPVVVENQPAAALTVGTGIAARATPDGYTLVMSDRSALTVAPHIYKSLPFDVARDFSPITLAARAPSVVVAHPSVPAATLGEFIEYAKRQPGQVDFGAGGIGTASHVANELLKQLTGIKLVNVHYKGGGPQVLAILSGEVKAGSALVANVLPHVRAGKMKAYVVTSKNRFAGAPDIPSAVEAGVPDLESEFWIGMLAPAGTPAELVGRLNREMVVILQSPAMQAALLAQGAESAASTRQEFAAFIKSETLKWQRVVRTAGVKPE